LQLQRINVGPHFEAIPSDNPLLQSNPANHNAAKHNFTYNAGELSPFEHKELHKQLAFTYLPLGLLFSNGQLVAPNRHYPDKKYSSSLTSNLNLQTWPK